MANKQIIHTSTQKFTEIADIKNDIVIFHNGSASLIIEVSPTNFALLSKEEQDAKIFAYASFLNSLTFPIQILINNKRVDISIYIKLLDTEIAKAKDSKVQQYMKGYQAFIGELVKQNIVLDKRFYIVVPYSYMEAGAVSTISHVGETDAKEIQYGQIKASLHTKAEGLISQLQRINLQTRVLEDDDLIALFHQMYNEEDIENEQDTKEGISA